MQVHAFLFISLRNFIRSGGPVLQTDLFRWDPVWISHGFRSAVNRFIILSVRRGLWYLDGGDSGIYRLCDNWYARVSHAESCAVHKKFT